MSALGLLSIVGLITRTLSAGAEALMVAQQAKGLLDNMLAENRDPTDAELDAALDRLKNLNQRIQDA
jgi:hypothetical protein